MKERGLVRRFMILIAALSVSLVLLWVGFYFITERITQRNMRLQAETASQALVMAVEDELLRLEDVSYSLSHDDRVVLTAAQNDTASFYDIAG